MGEGTPKQYRSLGGIPLLVYSLRILQQVDSISDIILSVPDSDRDYCWNHIVVPFGLEKVTHIVAGGARRQDSVRLGMVAIPGQPDVVVVHDGARPFIEKDIVEKVIQEAGNVGASVVAVPVQDTLKRVDATGLIQETLNREEIWQIQTPQAFQYNLLVEAHRLAQEEQWTVTDDAALLERMGHPVSVVKGSAWNVKMTTPQDLWLGEAIVNASEQSS